MNSPVRIITSRPEAKFVVMTKDLVDGLLAINTRNRALRPTAVASYMSAINNGMWTITNQGIGVSASGFLVDGQNRLNALVEADYPPVTMLLVTGLPDDAVAAVDTGANRSARDYLHFLFDTKVSALSVAIIRTSILAARGFTAMNQKLQPKEYADHLMDIGKGISAVLEVPKAGKLPAAVVAAIVDNYMNGYEDEALLFVDAVASGEMLDKTSPALVLRNWLNSCKSAGGTNIMVERYEKTTRAMQAFIEDKKLTKLYRAPVRERNRMAEAARAVNASRH